MIHKIQDWELHMHGIIITGCNRAVWPGLLDGPIRSFACSCSPICSLSPSSNTKYVPFLQVCQSSGLTKTEELTTNSSLLTCRSPDLEGVDPVNVPQSWCLTPSPVLLSSSCWKRDGCHQSLTPNMVCISAVAPKLTSISLNDLSPGANQSYSFGLLTESNTVKVLEGLCLWP